MRFHGPLILCALAIACNAPAAHAAPVADSGALADTLNAPMLLAPGTGAVSAPAPASVQAPRTRAEAKAAIRQERMSARLRIQEERYQRRALAVAVRDSARRLDNMLIGAAVSIHVLQFRPANDTDDTETAPSVGLLLGYRSHIAPKLGFKTGLHYHTGVTTVERAYEGDSWIYSDRSSATKGTTSGFDATAQMIVGPLGRFAFEPGILYGLGWHSAKAIRLTGSRDDIYTPKPRFTYLAGMLGASLFLGRHDQINPSGWLAVGKVLGRDGALAFQMGAAFTVAFREE